MKFFTLPGPGNGPERALEAGKKRLGQIFCLENADDTF